MILVTGATGFIGRSLVRELSTAGHPLRVLLRPSRRSPRLPRGVPVEVAVVSLADPRGLRAALNDVKIIFHLAGAEWQGRHANLTATDVEGTRNLVEAAVDAGVQRFIYLSHLGASRQSSFPVLQAKGEAEEHIRRSSLSHTILRSAIVYGPDDHFTTGLARLLRMAPAVFFIPGGGRTVLQPFWVEDLVACLLWTLDNPDSLNRVYELGGSEYFTVRQILEILMPIIHARRTLVELPIPLLRSLTVLLENTIPGFPASSFWVDYAFVSRTCPADSTSRAFGLMPARFTYRLDYLAYKPWWRRLSETYSARREEALERLRERFPRLPG